MARVLIVENLEPGQSPWWLQHLPSNPTVQFEIECISEASLLSALPKLLAAYRKGGSYDAIITNQDGYATFLFASLRWVSGRRRPLHFVMEFITKQRNASVYSRIKYGLMSRILRSVTRFICSAQRETQLYPEQLNLPRHRFVHIPLMTNPKFLTWETKYPESFISDDYVFAGGYTGRDFATFLDAVAEIDFPVRLITTPRAVAGLEVPPNVQLLFNLPFQEYIEHVARAQIVVVPLQNWDISVGQSVILEAMALARPLIATKAPGSVDYVQHETNGLLVSPGDAAGLRAAILRLLTDSPAARRLASNAREFVSETCTPAIVMTKVFDLIGETLETER